MPEFQIFHKIDTDFQADVRKPFQVNYLHVANVECERLSDTFRLTNHIDTDWTHNKGVVAFSMRNWEEVTI